jgi:hypothetical protein
LAEHHRSDSAGHDPFLARESAYVRVVGNAARERHMMSVTDIDEQPGAEVVQLHPAKAKKASERKWGKPVMDLGFCIIPSLLLRAQARLGLNPTQLAVLMHLADYWWEAERKPFPRMQTLGERLKLSPRQARRYVAELEAAGLVTRIERRAAHRGKLSTCPAWSSVYSSLSRNSGRSKRKTRLAGELSPGQVSDRERGPPDEIVWACKEPRPLWSSTCAARGGLPRRGALDKVTAGRRWQSAAGEVSRVRTSPVGRGRKLRPTPLRYV